VAPESTVDHLKVLIEAWLGHPPQAQMLCNGEFPLTDGGKSLAESGVVNGSVLTLMVKQKQAVAKSADCEWMFNYKQGLLEFNVFDLGHLSPVRWSGAVPIEKAIRDFEELKQTDQCDRAVQVKVPAGVFTETQEFETYDEAIAYLKRRDPAEFVRKQDAEKIASEAVKVARATKDAADAAVAAARRELAAKEEMLMQAKARVETANDAANSASMFTDTVQSDFDFADLTGDAAAEVAEAQSKLESAMAHASWAGASLEEANKKAEQATSELHEITYDP